MGTKFKKKRRRDLLADHFGLQPNWIELIYFYTHPHIRLAKRIGLSLSGNVNQGHFRYARTTFGSYPLQFWQEKIWQLYHGVLEYYPKMLVLKLPPVVSSHIGFCSFYRKEINLLDEINKMLLTSKKDVMPWNQSQYMKKHFDLVHNCSI
jgi:hypothetical protein